MKHKKNSNDIINCDVIIMTNATQHYCIITNKQLDSKTLEEHTIPRCLGGRIRSKIVSSKEFNEACGRLYDPRLRAQYVTLLSLLAPAMSAEHDPGKIHTTSSTGRHYITQNGVTQPAKVDKTETGDNGNLKTFTGPAEQVKKITQHLQKITGLPSHIEYVPSPDSETSQPVEIISSAAELTILKSSLLSFDHLLADTPNHRFTRSTAILPLIQYLRRVILEGSDLEPCIQQRHILGLQLDNERELNLMASKLREKISNYVYQEFEHTMIAVGDTTNGTLDVAWHIFDGEWQGVRLATNWTEYDFTCMFINQVLCHGNVFGPVWLDNAASLCRPSSYKSINYGSKSQVSQKTKETIDILNVIRWENQKKEILFADMKCDSPLITGIIAACLSNAEGGHSLNNALIKQLKRRYPPKLHDNANFQRIINEISQVFSGYASIKICTPEEGDKVDWEPIISSYRKGLQKLVCEFGLPGYFFSAGVPHCEVIERSN